MLFWIGKIVLFSILFIYLLHSIFLFLSNALTIPKTKDIVQITNDNYKNIYEMLAKKTEDDEFQNLTPIDSLPNNSITNNDDMKNELSSYLRNQLL
jgi:hypothetical protein